jgi:hypothetical protein
VRDGLFAGAVRAAARRRLEREGVGNSDISAMTELDNAQVVDCQGLRYVSTGPGIEHFRAWHFREMSR